MSNVRHVVTVTFGAEDKVPAIMLARRMAGDYGERRITLDLDLPGETPESVMVAAREVRRTWTQPRDLEHQDAEVFAAIDALVAALDSADPGQPEVEADAALSAR